MVEPGPQRGRDERDLGHPLPPQQEIVEVEHALALLGGDIGGEQPLQLGGPLRAPGKSVAEHPVQGCGRVHRIGVDREAGALLREAAVSAGEAQLLARHVEQVGGVAAVEDREPRGETDRIGVLAQELSAHRMERPSPVQAPSEARPFAQGGGADPFSAGDHHLGGAAGEGQEQDALGVGTLEDQLCHAMGERGGLACTRPGQNQQRLSRPRYAVVRHAVAARRGAVPG